MLVATCVAQILLVGALVSVSAREVISLQRNRADLAPFRSGKVSDMEPWSISNVQEIQVSAAFGRTAGMRALQKQAQEEKVTVVTTPQQLLDAVAESGPHIEIRAHLDLTTVTPLGNGNVKRMFNIDDEPSSDFGNSIRGNCKSQPSAAALGLSGTAGLGDWQPGQCVIVTDVRLMSVFQNLWLHGLYIRHRATTRTGTNVSSAVWCGSEDCNLWMTDVTFQGDGSQDPSYDGLVVQGGQAHGEGLSIIDFSSYSALFISDGATVNLEGCTISRNTISNTFENSAVISVNAVDPDDDFVQQQNTVLRLQQCTLSGNAGPNTLTATTVSPFSLFDVEIYSDMEREVHFTSDSPSKGSTLPLNQAPASRPGIDASSPWFLNVQQIFAVPERSRNNNTAAIVGGGMAVVLMCLATVCFIIIRKRRRRSRNQAKAENAKHGAMEPAGNAHQPAPPVLDPGAEAKATEDSLELFSLSVPQPAVQPKGDVPAALNIDHEVQQATGLSMTSASNANTASMTSASNASAFQHCVTRGLVSTVSASDQTSTVPDTVTGGSESRVASHTLPQASGVTMPQQEIVLSESQPAQESGMSTGQKDTFEMTRTDVSLLPPPGPDSSNDEKMDFLQQQLDSFGVKTPIFDDLLSLGSGETERRQGGQAVVQMAVRDGTMEQYAIKFFLSASAYNDEHGLYRQGSGVQGGDLAQFLPKVLKVHSNKDKKFKDVHRYPLPPCIVMERGESLDLWAARRHPDRTQAFTMINQLSSRLRELHKMGYVHRDLKPGNVMWLPRENRWTIIDFGCVARTGEVARLGFSMAYAAPEVISAYWHGDRTMVAQEAVDVWSLGVMAFELLTGEPALAMVGKDKVMDRIEGLNGLQLPWEGTLPPAVRRKLGIFRGSVLQLLARDPAHRPSMVEFCRSCDRALAGSTSVQL